MDTTTIIFINHISTPSIILKTIEQWEDFNLKFKLFLSLNTILSLGKTYKIVTVGLWFFQNVILLAYYTNNQIKCTSLKTHELNKIEMREVPSKYITF